MSLGPSRRPGVDNGSRVARPCRTRETASVRIHCHEPERRDWE